MDDNVTKAFDLLIEEIVRYRDGVAEAGAAAMRRGDLDAADNSVAKLRGVDAFRSKVEALQGEWVAVEAGRLVIRRSSAPPRRDTRRPREADGDRTGQAELSGPILCALHRLGGSAPVQDVLREMESAIGSSLTDTDRAPRSGRGDVPRWWQTSYNARTILVKQGLLRDDSPARMWELTVEGRQRAAQAARESAHGADSDAETEGVR